MEQTTKEDVLSIISGKSSTKSGQTKVKQDEPQVENPVEPTETSQSAEPVQEKEVKPEEKQVQEVESEEKQVEPTPEVKEDQTEKPVEPVEPQVSVTESEEYKKLQSQFEALKAERDEYESLLNDSDPLKYFVNENEYKKQQILKNNPDIDVGVLDTLFGADLEALSPVDILVHDLMARTGEKDLGEIKEHILSKYEYDPDGGKIPFSLKADANEAKKRLKEIVGQEVPAPKNIKSLLESRRQEAEANIEKINSTFRPMAEKLAEEMKDISDGKGKDAISYQYDPKFRQQIPDMVMDILKNGGANLDNAETMLSEARKIVNNVYRLENFDQIVQSQVDEAVAKKDDEWRAKVHNPKQTSQQQAPDTGDKRATPEDAKRIVRG